MRGFRFKVAISPVFRYRKVSKSRVPIENMTKSVIPCSVSHKSRFLSKSKVGGLPTAKSALCYAEALGMRGSRQNAIPIFTLGGTLPSASGLP